MGYDVDCCGIPYFHRKVGELVSAIMFLVGYVAGIAMTILAVTLNDR